MTEPYADTPEPVHVVQPPPQDDETVRKVAEILLTAASIAAAATAIAALLGIPRRGVLIALSFSRERGSTAHRPNARHAVNGVSSRGPTGDFARSYSAIELYYRAAFVVNASRRIWQELRDRKPTTEIIATERRYYDMHEQARRQRLDAASQIAGAVAEHGNLLGWYLDPELNNEIECVRANGNNFYANRPPIIGLPGMVHARCGCFAGAPHFGGGMVDDAVADIVRLEGRTTPKAG